MKVKKFFSFTVVAALAAAVVLSSCKKDEPTDEVTLEDFVGTYEVHVLASAGMMGNVYDDDATLTLQKDGDNLKATTTISVLTYAADVATVLSDFKATDNGFLFKVAKQPAVEIAGMGTVEVEGTGSKTDGYDGVLTKTNSEKTVEFVVTGEAQMGVVPVTLTITVSKKQ